MKISKKKALKSLRETISTFSQAPDFQELRLLMGIASGKRLIIEIGLTKSQILELLKEQADEYSKRRKELE